MSEILAGISSGFLMGVIFIGLGALLIVPSQNNNGKTLQVDEEKTISKKWSMGLPVILILVWGFGLGPLFGLSLLVFKRALPLAGLGSSNMPYTLSIVFLSVVFVMAVLFIQKSRIREKIGLIACFAVIIGWILPLLAS